MKSPGPSTIRGQIPLLLCPHVPALFPLPRLDTAAPIRSAVNSFEAASPEGGSLGQRPHLLPSLSSLFPSFPSSFPIPRPPLLFTPSILPQGFPDSSVVKNPPAVQKTQVWSLGWEDPLEKGMTIHSSILAWRSLWTEKPGGLQSVGSQNWTRLSDYAQHTVESAPACPCQNTFHDIEKESNCWAHLCNFKTVLFS